MTQFLAGALLGWIITGPFVTAALARSYGRRKRYEMRGQFADIAANHKKSIEFMYRRMDILETNTSVSLRNIYADLQETRRLLNLHNLTNDIEQKFAEGKKRLAAQAKKRAR